jgi:PAP2 superfamily protein
MSRRHRILLAVVFVLVGRGYAAADAITDWNAFLLSTAVPGGRPANEIGIAAGYMHIAIYDAIVAIDGGFTPFATTVSPVPPGASREAAVAAASNRVLTALYPAFAGAITAHYNAAVAAVSDPIARADGIAIGLAAANGLLSWRHFPNDGWQASVPYVYVTPPVAGSYQRTPPSFQPTGPVTPWVKQLQPFTMRSPSQFRADGPPALTSRQWAEDFNEVMTLGALVGSTRTPEQTTISLFYANATAALAINPALQISLDIRGLSNQEGLTLAENARFFAQAYTSIADATIGCWESKYYFNFWRPVTAIRNADIDGNDQTQPDTGWLPFTITAGHPEYPSAHGCITSAMAHSMAYFLGTKRPAKGIPLSGTDVNGSIYVRQFDSTDEVVREIIDARIYNGVHYRTSVVHATVLGRKVAQWVARYNFLPLDSPHAR